MSLVQVENGRTACRGDLFVQRIEEIGGERRVSLLYYEGFGNGKRQISCFAVSRIYTHTEGILKVLLKIKRRSYRTRKVPFPATSKP